MYAVADWGAYTHEHPHHTSNESDLELIQASDVYDYATHEVRQHVSARLAESQVLIAFADHL